jgi:hypothetical protein
MKEERMKECLVMQARRRFFQTALESLRGLCEKAIAEKRGILMPLHYVKFKSQSAQSYTQIFCVNFQKIISSAYLVPTQD